MSAFIMKLNVIGFIKFSTHKQIVNKIIYARRQYVTLLSTFYIRVIIRVDCVVEWKVPGMNVELPKTSAGNWRKVV